ncbi:MAG TPA: thioesterase family protein [Chitinophagaceae bacterium]|jgi:acyl-CoA thioester hydrolase|nr:thioesterase family protein [Chitinophagaceae bacterium]
MKSFVKDIQLRWSDLDPNFHLRHSIYYDWGAFSRIEFLREYDLTAQIMQQLHFGPILFREECLFRKEIRDGDKITIDLTLLKARKDYSKWSIRHRVMKNTDTLSAILTVDGAWIDTVKRKLTLPPSIAEKVFSEMPVDENFQWME